MEKNILNLKSKVLKVSYILMVAAILFFIPGKLYVGQSENYFRDTLVKSGLMYASIMGTNAVVSVLKESEFNVEPGGLGVTLAVGELLDPLDDLTERISTILVYSIVALGTQEILLQAGELLDFKIISVLLILSLIGLSKNTILKIFGNGMLKLTFILLLLRFLLPANVYLNKLFYDGFLAQKAESYRESLSYLVPDEENIIDLQKQENSVAFDWTFGISNATEKIDSLKKEYDVLKKNFTEIISTLLSIGSLYVSGFLFQVLFLPFMSIFIIYQLYRIPMSYY
jgi:hypothetical protein